MSDSVNSRVQRCFYKPLCFLAVLISLYSGVTTIFYMPLYADDFTFCLQPNYSLCCSSFSLVLNETNCTENINQNDDCRLSAAECRKIQVLFLLAILTDGLSLFAAILLGVFWALKPEWNDCTRFLRFLALGCLINLSLLFLALAAVPVLLAVCVYGIYRAVIYCRKSELHNRNISTPPLELNLLVRKGLVSQASEAVRVAVEQLVVKSWDETLTGVGRDATELTHSRIQIKNIYIVKNSNLKAVYEDAYETTLQRLGNVDSTTFDFDETTLRTSQILSTIPDLPPHVFTLRRHEVLLFHGTPQAKVSDIIQLGLKASKNVRSPYGKGTYLTDSAQKADQYADKLGPRTNKGLTIFLVRVALGWTVKEEFSHLDCDTVVASRGKLFPEFVAKKDENLLAQLLIVYNRVSSLV